MILQSTVRVLVKLVMVIFLGTMYSAMRKPTYVSGVFLALLLSACSGGPITTQTYTRAPQGAIVEGDNQTMFGQSIQSWEVLESNASGRVAGINMSLSLIRDAGKTSTGPVTLAMPPDIQKSTSIDHMDVEYLPVGIGTDFQQPAFAFRIYWIPRADQNAIDCSDTTKVGSDLVVGGYTDPTGTGSICVRGVGERSMQEDVAPDPDHPTPYARVNFGYYKGKMIFMEFEITTAKLQSKDNFTVLPASPTAIGGSAQIPANFTGVYQSKTDSYDLSIWSFSNPDSASSSGE